MTRLVLAALVTACAMAAATPESATTAASTAAQLTRSDRTAQTLTQTLDAVENAVAYMGRHSGSINLDGGIGVRTVEGQFGVFLTRYWTHLPLWTVARLMSVQTLASRVAKATVETVRRNTPVYYANVGQLIADHSWDTFFPSRRLPPNSVTELPKDAASVAAGEGNFDEKFSDDCVHEFYGLDGRPPCAISARCWNTMVLSEKQEDYSLTHQLFYLLTGINASLSSERERANCLSNLASMARTGGPPPLQPPLPADGGRPRHPLRALLDSFCGRILAAATAQASRRFHIWDRDLFMEQIGLCGFAGYAEFARPDWRTLVIGWQRANGCYGTLPGETVEPEHFRASRYGSFKRRKRSEALMSEDGCLSHVTSVAIGALVAFVRREVEAIAAASRSNSGV